MATGQTYPKISRRIWWLLRDRLKKSVPSSVTPTLIDSLSPMSDASAKSNVRLPLRELGLIDETGKPTSLAERWRHDDDYSAVCHEIRKTIYPHELVEAFPEPDNSKRDSIKTWFMKVGQVGEDAAKRYTDTYLLLSEADPSKADEKSNGSTTSTGARKTAKETQSAPSKRVSPPKVPPAAATDPSSDFERHPRRLPAIHIDVQVHISPDTPPEQIDRIFESMAKHLGGFIK